MSDFVNTKNFKVALLLAATAALSVYCDEADDMDRRDMLNAVLSLDTPRLVVAYGSFVVGAFVPIVIARKFKDRVDQRDANFGMCAVVLMLCLLPFVKNWVSGRQHAMYLSALIVALAPALTALSFVGIHTALSYGPKEYAELIFKLPPVDPEKPKPSEKTENAITEAQTKIAAIFAKNEQRTEEQASEYLALLSSVNASIVAESTATDRRRAFEYILKDYDEHSQEFANMKANKEISELIAKVKKLLQEIDQKELVDNYNYLEGKLTLPKKRDLKVLKEAAEKYKFVEEHMPEEPQQQEPKDQQEFVGVTSQGRNKPSERDMEKEEMYPVKEEEPKFAMAAEVEYEEPSKDIEEPSKEEIEKIEKEKQGKMSMTAGATAGPSKASATAGPSKASAAAAVPEKKTVTRAECMDLLHAVGLKLANYALEHFSNLETMKEAELGDIFFVYDSIKSTGEGVGDFWPVYEAVGKRHKALKEKQEQEKAKKEDLENKKKDEKSKKREKRPDGEDDENVD